MVDLVGVQADRLHQVDLDLIAGGDSAHEVGSGASDVLGDREDRGDVVARVGVLGREEGVVVVELANGDSVGPGRPLGTESSGDAEHRGSRLVGVVFGLRPGGDGRGAGEGGGGHRCVVDQPVDHHLGDLRGDRHGVSGDFGDLPGELVFAGEVLRTRVDSDGVQFHGVPFGAGLVAPADWWRCAIFWMFRRAWCR
jgi:hypothetical protein